jgi:hypothetical protein
MAEIMSNVAVGIPDKGTKFEMLLHVIINSYLVEILFPHRTQSTL